MPRLPLPGALVGLLALPAVLVTALTLPAASLAQSITVEIDVSHLTPSASTVGLRGGTAPLSWDHPLPMSDPDGDGVYSAQVAFPEGTGAVEYKAVVEPRRGELVWEPGGNRVLLPGRMTRDRRAFGGAQRDLPALTVSPAQLAEDIAVLRDALETLHPGLALHATEVELAAAWDPLAREVRDVAATHGEAIPLWAVYLPIARAVAAVRDGHTQVSLFNQSAYTEAMLYRAADRVPFAFRLVGERMVVTGDATAGGALPTGTEILTLDGRTVSDVLAAMRPYVPADGFTDARRRYLLQVGDLAAPAERFDVLYGLLFPPDGDLALTVREPNGMERAVRVPRTTAAARRDELLARDPALPRTRDDLLHLSFLDAETALLRVGTFATFSMERDYDRWLREAFHTLRQRRARRLVVDLRGNGGGMDDAAVLLLAHLLHEPLRLTPWQQSTAYRVVPERLRPHLRSWSDEVFDLSRRVSPSGDGTFALPISRSVTVRPARHAFAGDLAVVVDAGPSSATFTLARVIQANGVAPLVGQMTGGSLKGLNGSQMVLLTLPHTGLVVDLPLIAARPPTPGLDRGVIPDVLVDPDADAVIAGRDPDLEAALALLTSSASVPPASDPALPLQDLVGAWTGALVYTDYGDDASRVTLGATAQAEPVAGGVRFAVSLTEPDGSPAGTGMTTLRERTDGIEYDGETWREVSRAVSPGGFRLVIEREAQDKGRPATIRHTIALAGAVLTNRKEVRYRGTDVFFDRTVFSASRR